MKIVVCSSGDFYKELFPIKEELEGMGHEVILPSTAHKMRESGNFDVSHYKTWYENPEHFTKKTDLMNAHFEEIKRGDVILVVNLEKKGFSGYVGGNVLLEMFYAQIEGKPIFVLHDVPKTLPLYEEVLGLMPKILHGELGRMGEE